MKISLNSTIKVANEQVSSNLGDEVAILNLKNSVYYGLDTVGAQVWELLQTPSTVAEIRDSLLAEYAIDVETCTHDLLDLLAKMEAADLIDVVQHADQALEMITA